MLTEVNTIAPHEDTATLYLRGIPRELAWEAKSEAARRGMSLTAFAREALTQALRSPTDRIGQPEGIETIRPDLDWFKANRTRLLQRYRNQYIAIVNQKVVDHASEFGPLARRVLAKYGMRSIAMPKVTPEERIVEVPTPVRVER